MTSVEIVLEGLGQWQEFDLMSETRNVRKIFAQFFVIIFIDPIPYKYILLTFEQDNNVDDEEIMMRMRYVDRNGNRVPLLEKPSRVIITEQKEIVQQLRNFIADNNIHADNQFGHFYISCWNKNYTSEYTNRGNNGRRISRDI